MTPFYSEPEHQPFALGDGEHGVLLIHGFPGTPAELRPLGNFLAQAGYSAHGLLLPGFGPDIPNLADRDRADWLETVRRYWHEEMAQYSTRSLLGYSMGGAIALNLVNELEPNFLLLLAPFWRFGGWQWRLLPLIRWFKSSVAPFENADFSDPDLRKQLGEIMPDADLDDPTVQETIRSEITLPLAVLDEVRKLGCDAYRNASAVKTPTFVMQGMLDATVLPEFTQKLISRLRSRVQFQPIDAGHAFVKPGQAQDAYWKRITIYLTQQREPTGI